MPGQCISVVFVDIGVIAGTEMADSEKMKIVVMRMVVGKQLGFE